MSILSVGTVAFDAIETPFGKTDKIIGGAATYFCLAASFFSNKINLVSIVGDDFPSTAIEMLKKHNINTKGLEIIRGEKTFFWSGRYHVNMNIRDTLETQLNVLEKFNPVLPEEFKQPEFLMLGNLTPSIQKKAINQITNQPKLVVLDTMNFWMDHFMKDLKETIKKIDVLTINDDEARQLSEEHSLVTAAEKILKMGPKYLIIKKGEHGALLFDKKQTFYVPALPLKKVLDPTGAGDSFAGGFVGSLEQSKEISFKNMKKALVNATAIASFCVEDFGTKKLTQITKSDLEKRTQKIINLVTV